MGPVVCSPPVQKLLEEIDPDGCEMRQAHRLRRPVYVNTGPNSIAGISTDMTSVSRILSYSSSTTPLISLIKGNSVFKQKD